METVTNEALAARLRELREAEGLSQKEFGEALGVDQPTISKIESGTRSVSARELAVASSLLGVSIGELLDADAPEPVLLRAESSGSEAVADAIRLFNTCIDEYRGVEALAG